jgi:ADP-heptose:LPS heptosyltransferase
MKDILSNCRNILIIKLRYLGDSIWMLPFVDNLKRNMPHARLTVLVNEGTETFFKTSPSVTNIMTFPRREIKRRPLGVIKLHAFMKELRRLKPDAVIEMTDADRPAIIGLLSGAKIRIGYDNEKRWRRRLYTHIIQSRIDVKHMVDYHLDILRELGLKVYDDAIKIPLDGTCFQSLNKKYPSLLDDDKRRKVIVHPGARNALRQWGADNFASICDTLSTSCRVFLVVGPNERKIADSVLKRMKSRPEICASDLNLFEFAALCELSDIFIGNDSGPIHIASAKTFTVGIYGPTLAKLAGPWTKKKLIFESPPLHCRPCRQEVCHNAEFRACLNSITPERVAKGIQKVLSALNHKG